MHSAPSVSFPVGRSRMAQRLLWGTWAFGAAAWLAWCVQFSGAPWRTALLAVALATAAWAARSASRLGEGALLRWDGMHWSCDGAAAMSGASAAIHLDFQSFMLVRLHEKGRSAAWFWLDRVSCPERWLDLRRALYAAAPRAVVQVLPQP